MINERRNVRSIDRPVRVAVVDDHVLVCSLLVDWLSRHGFEAKGLFAPTDSDLLASFADTRPDVVVLDDDLGDQVGMSLRFIAPAIELGALVVMLTGGDDRVFQARCIEEGAAGIIHKRIRPAELVAAVEGVVDGRSLLTPAQRIEYILDLRRARNQDEQLKAPFSSLTERESQVLTAICGGESASEIAVSWEVSVATIRTHIRSVLVKLGVGSQLEAAAMARRAEWPWQSAEESPSILMKTS